MISIGKKSLNLLVRNRSLSIGAIRRSSRSALVTKAVEKRVRLLEFDPAIRFDSFEIWIILRRNEIDGTHFQLFDDRTIHVSAFLQRSLSSRGDFAFSSLSLLSVEESVLTLSIPHLSPLTRSPSWHLLHPPSSNISQTRVAASASLAHPHHSYPFRVQTRHV